MPEKPSVTLPGTVEKNIPSPSPEKADTVQISVETALIAERQLEI